MSMIPPTKEVHIFLSGIRPWIESDEIIEGKYKFNFLKGTPDYIIKKYNKISRRIDFIYKDKN